MTAAQEKRSGTEARAWAMGEPSMDRTSVPGTRTLAASGAWATTAPT